MLLKYEDHVLFCKHQWGLGTSVRIYMLCFARLKISLDLSHGILESLTLVNTRIRGQGFQFSDWSKWPPSQPSYWLF